MRRKLATLAFLLISFATVATAVSVLPGCGSKGNGKSSTPG